jgi:hypothetical protein
LNGLRKLTELFIDRSDIKIGPILPWLEVRGVLKMGQRLLEIAPGVIRMAQVRLNN